MCGISEGEGMERSADIRMYMCTVHIHNRLRTTLKYILKLIPLQFYSSQLLNTGLFLVTEYFLHCAIATFILYNFLQCICYHVLRLCRELCRFILSLFFMPCPLFCFCSSFWFLLLFGALLTEPSDINWLSGRKLICPNLLL